jgi:hypothetical protein
MSNDVLCCSFPAIHEEALAQLNVFRAVYVFVSHLQFCASNICGGIRQRLMANARIPNFGFHDLYEPKPDRFRFVLSGIINFVRFSDDIRRSVQEQAEELVRFVDLHNEAVAHSWLVLFA